MTRRQSDDSCYLLPTCTAALGHRARTTAFPSHRYTPLQRSLSLAVALYYLYSNNWLCSNIFGIAFSIQGIELLSLGSYLNGAILLSGLFVYDIFCTAALHSYFFSLFACCHCALLCRCADFFLCCVCVVVWLLWLLRGVRH